MALLMVEPINRTMQLNPPFRSFPTSQSNPESLRARGLAKARPFYFVNRVAEGEGFEPSEP